MGIASRHSTMDYRHTNPLRFSLNLLLFTLFSIWLMGVDCGNESERLQFLSEPESILAAADGRRVSYKCLVSPLSASIKWLLNGTILGNNSYDWARLSGNKLFIKLQKQVPSEVGRIGDPSTSIDLQGAVFQCLAEWNNLTIVSQPAKLIIAELHPFDQHEDQQVTTIVGNTAVISCHLPKSIPYAVTEYVFNNITINYNHGRYRLLPSGNLQILDAKQTDSGNYKCVAHNPFLQERVYANYLVNLKVVKSRHQAGIQLRNLHFVVKPKENINAVIGSNITLECVVNGFPVPKINWSRANGDLSKKRTYVEGGNLLIITLMKEDEGTYTCTATNGKATITFAVVLEVNETPQILEENAYKLISIKEGQDHNLKCPAKGHPKPIISWIHNGYYIDSMSLSNEGTRLSFHENSSILRIHNADSKLHSGIFQCFATNELGTTHSIKLINFKSGPAMSEEHIVNKDTGYHHHDSRHHSDHNRHHHSHHNKHHERQEKVHPKEISEPNNISSNSNSSGDEDFESDHNPERTHSTHLQGAKKPDDSFYPDSYESHPKKKKQKNHHKNQKMIPPSKPEVNKISDDSVMVRWTAEQSHVSMPILFFKVQFKEKGTLDWWTVDADIPPHILSYEVSGLKPDVVYKFRIAAVYSNDDNKSGPSSAKFVLHRSSSGREPANAPSIMNGIAISQSEVTVQWKFSNIDEVPIVGFLIYYRPADSAGEYLKIAVNGVNGTEYNLTHLEPNTPYEIKMRCFNAAGTSEFSNIYTIKTLPLADSDNSVKKTSEGEKKFDDDRVNRLDTNLFNSTLNLDNKTQLIAIYIAVVILALVLITCLLICIVRIRNAAPSSKVIKKAKPPTTPSDYYFSSNSMFDRRPNGQLSVKVKGNGNLTNGNGLPHNSPSSPTNQAETDSTMSVNQSNGRLNGTMVNGETMALTSTLNRRGTLRSQMSYSSHHLYNSTANRLNEAHHDQHPMTMSSTNTATIDRKRMVKSVLDPYPEYHNRMPSNHSTSFTRLNGTLERKKRSRTDLNTLDRSYHPRNGTLERHSTYLPPNGPIVIMQSSC